MALFQMQIETEYPVLFLSDDADHLDVPADTAASFVTATANCLCFWVLAYVDGASVVSISDAAPQTSGSLMFSGSVQAPSGMLTLSDSGAFRYLNIPVNKGRVGIDVWADDPKNPDWVWIKLDAIKGY